MVAIEDDGLIPFEQTIRDVRSSRSLLMCYCCHLPYLESSLLASLQSEGEAAVTVLVDRTDYAESFADLNAVVGPGVLYSLYPVHLPNERAAFHPKLYGMFGTVGATLVVASANLTFYGARTNAEVLDVLRLTYDGNGDRAAFRSYADLLELIPSLDPALPELARQSVAVHAGRIRSILTGSGSNDGDGPLLLHSGRLGLLEQLRSQIPAAEVSSITAVSPFFDPGSLALRELAKAYPDARLRVVKGQADGDFNGAAVASLGRRLTVQRLSSVAGQSRRLHAKLLVLQGPRKAWVVSGSANLTAPAWLRSVHDGGNLEAVVLRQVQTRDVKRLWVGVDVEPVDWRSQVHLQSSAIPASGEAKGIEIMHAALRGPELRVQCRGDGWEHVAENVTVVVEDRYRRSSAKGTVAGSGTVSVRADLGTAAFEGADAPALVSLTVEVGDGITRIGRAWLDRPDQLNMSAEIRALHRAREAALNRFAGSSDQWELLAREFAAFVGVVFGRAEAGRTTPNATEGTGPAPRSDDTRDGVSLTAEELLVDESAIVMHGGGARSRGMALFESILSSVQRMFQDEPTAPPYSRHPRDTVPDTGPDELEDEEDPGADEIRDGGLASERPLVSAGAIRTVSTELSELWAVITSSSSTPERVDDVLKILEATVAGFLLPLYLQIDASEVAERALVVQAMRHAWSRVISIHGVAEGQPAGWLVQAWIEPRSRTAIDAALVSPDRVGRLVALLAATTLGIDVMSRAPHGGHVETIEGLRVLLRGRWPEPGAQSHEAVNRAFQQLVEHLPELRELGDPLSALSSAVSGELQLVTSVRQWSTVARLLLRDDGVHDVRALKQELGIMSGRMLSAYNSSRRRYSPAAVPGLPTTRGLMCGGCHTLLSNRLADALRRLEFEPLQCEACGRLLVPVDFHNAAVREILAVLAPELSFLSDPLRS